MTHAQHLIDFGQSIRAEIDPILRIMQTELLARLRADGPFLPSLDRPASLAVQEVLAVPDLTAPWAVALRRELQVEIDLSLREAQRGPEDTKVAASATLGLRLMDDDEVEEDIALSHFIQELENAAESTLRELRALSASLRAVTVVTRESALLYPGACATALGRTVRSLPLQGAARRVCLQRLAQAMVPAMARAYAGHVQRLKDAGVEAARFNVMPTPLPSGALAPRTQLPAGAGSGAASPGAAGIEQLLQLLIAQVEMEHTAPAAGGGGAGSGAAGARPGAAALATPASGGLPAEVGARVMHLLMHQLAQDAGASEPMRRLFQQLEGPGLRLADREPAVWTNPTHPWWQMLDRLLALCAVLDEQPGGGQDRLARQCAPVVTGLMDAALVDEAACRDALGALSGVSQTLPLASGGEQPAVLSRADAGSQAGRPEDALRQLLREQMAEQLRGGAAPASVRRLLMGPWVDVLHHASESQPAGGALLQQRSDVVDQLLAAVATPPTEVALQSLLDQVRAGLSSINLPEAQIEQWLFDLTLRLAGSAGPAEEAQQAWRHDELPTVPIDLHGSVAGARARRDCEAWLRSLRVGDICRVFLDAQWQTLHLTRVDEAEQTFELQGRGGAGVPQLLTRHALARLRNEGLATTVEIGAFLTQAMDTMVSRLAPDGGPGRHGH